MEIKHAIPHTIRIEASINNGYIVHVGCMIAVYTAIDMLVEDLRKYLNNPTKYGAKVEVLCGPTDPQPSMAEMTPPELGRGTAQLRPF